MAAVHGVILKPGRRVLPPHHQGIVGVVEGIGAQAAQDGLLQLRAGRPDGQHHTGLLLAGGQRHDLVHLPLIGGHDHDLGTLGPGQQLEQGQHGGEAGLALPAGQHPPGQPRPRPRIPGRGDQGPPPGR
jgi:hypothetical protein